MRSWGFTRVDIRRRKSRWMGVLALALLNFLSLSAQAVSQIVRIDGAIYDDVGAPVSANKDIQIKAYDAATNGTLLWTSSVYNVTVASGRFTLNLDAADTSVSSPSLVQKLADLSAATGVYFEIHYDAGTAGNATIDTDRTVRPRFRGRGSIFALTAANAATLNGVTVSASQLNAVAGKQDALGYTPLNSTGGSLSGSLLLGQRNELRFGDTGTHYVGIRSPDSLSANLQWTLPSGDGAEGQIMKFNATTKTFYWAADAGASGGVSGPGATTATNQLSRWSDSSGTSVKGSSVVIDDSGNVSGVGILSGTGANFSGLAGSRLVLTSGTSSLVSSGVAIGDTELSYLVGVTSGVQGQLNTANASISANTASIAAKEPSLTKGTVNGSSSVNIAGVATNSVIGTGFTISVATANASTNGLLTSTDWNTFNGKQAALGFTPVNKAGDTMSGNLQLANQKEVQFAGTSNTFVGFKAPASIASNVTWTLPNADGGANQVLQTSGSGILTWVTSTGGTVTTVAGSGTVSTTGTSAITISVTTATASANGVLTSTDWNTFNGKQAALGFTPVNKAGDTMSASLQLANQNSVQFAGTSNTFVGFKAPASITSNVTWTLPNADGAANQVLQTNGTGILTWVTSTGGTVTTVAGSGTVSTTGTSAITISVTTANGSTNGILTSTDWTTFNSKEPAQTKGSITTTTTGVTVGSGSNSTVGPAVTININTAAAGTTGLLSGIDWTTFNNKQAALGFTPGNKAGDTMSGSLQLASQNSVQFAGTTSGVYVGFKAPASITSNVTWTLPNADGAANQVLQTSGSGILTWVTSTGGTVATVAGSGTVSTTGTSAITISVTTAGTGANGIITSTDWNTFNGKEPTVSKGTLAAGGSVQIAGVATNSVIGTGFTISVTTATSSANGVLSSTDWTTFNNKQAALGYTPINKAADTMTGALGLSYSGANTNTVLTLDSQRRIVSSSVTDTELGFLAGVTSALQGQISWSPASGTNIYFNGIGNVGIGTSSPGQKLSVYGTIESVTGGIKFPDGSIQYTSAYGSGTNNTMQSGLPDVVQCAYNSTNGDMVTMYNGNPLSAGTVTYMSAYYGVTYSITFNSNGTYNTSSNLYNGTSYNCISKSTAQLYSTGQAFNFAKGPVGQLLQSGSNAYYNAGNLGIGVSSPAATLDVAGTLRLEGANVGYSAIRSPSTAGNVTWTLPNADGAANQVLQTNGTGILTWVTPSAGSVTSVSGSGSVSASGTSAIVITVATATTSTNGILTSTDWNTFNAKEPALTKGAVSGSSSVSIAGVATSSVIGTGFTISVTTANTSTNGLLTSTDWTTFNNKQAALGFTPANKAGDTMTGALQVTGAITATTTLNAATVNVSGLSANGVIVADGAKNLISVAPSTSGNVLMSNGTSWASTTPAYFNQTCNVGYYLRGFDASGNKVCTSIHAELTISKTADGYLNSCAIMSDTSLVCWGYNGVGQLGDGTQTAAPNDLEHYVRGSDGMAITGVTDVTSAEQHTCIVKSDGTVWCWGQNNTGQLGIGNLTNTFNPTQVINLTSATQVSAGEAGTCALRADGSVFCWGYGAYGQMGVNTTTANNSTPIQVSGITSATAVSMGGQNVCALLSDQTMKCWGLNIVGALGDGTATERNTPVAVINMTGITQMSTSPASAGASYYGHTCAMKSNGTVWCWGYNPNGELGTGNTTNQSTPTQTLGITTAVSLAVGYGTNCAVLADGTAKCWGYNGTYAVGDGTATSRTTPTLVIGIGGAATLTGITAISISRAQSGSAGAHAITNTGAVYAWGPNSQGQLGNGTTTASMSPVGVRY